MKRKALVSIGIAVLLLLGVVAAVYAADRVPTADMWVSGTGTLNNSNPLIVTSSKVGEAYTYNGTALLKFDISSIASAPVPNKLVGSATLTLTTGSFSSVPSSSKLTLFAVTDDTWTESLGNPVVGTPLVTVTVGPGNLPAGTMVTFPSTPAFVNYINQQSGSSGVTGDNDNIVSLAIRFTDLAAVAVQQFQDRSTVTPPLLTLANPNAVTVGSFEATERTTVNSPFYLALGVLSIVLVGAMIVARRRTSAI